MHIHFKYILNINIWRQNRSVHQVLQFKRNVTIAVSYVINTNQPIIYWQENLTALGYTTFTVSINILHLIHTAKPMLAVYFWMDNFYLQYDSTVKSEEKKKEFTSIVFTCNLFLQLYFITDCSLYNCLKTRDNVYLKKK